MTNELAFTMGKTLSTDSLSAYVTWVNQIPMLTQQEEHELATRLMEKNDLEAARKLILSHLRLVVKIARGYSGYGLVQADLIQEGNIGLMKAVKRFDPKVGVRLVSYALHWIKAEIHEFVLRNWRIVKIATTKSQRKLFFNLRKLSKNAQLSQDDVTMIAKELNVSKKDVLQIQERMNSHDESFDNINNDDSSSSWSHANQLEDTHSNHAEQLEHDDWQNNQKVRLQQVIKTLDERSQDILTKRWFNETKSTLHELAAEYNISAERVRQIEKNALTQLKGLLETPIQ